MYQFKVISTNLTKNKASNLSAKFLHQNVSSKIKVTKLKKPNYNDKNMCQKLKVKNKAVTKEWKKFCSRKNTLLGGWWGSGDQPFCIMSRLWCIN